MGDLASLYVRLALGPPALSTGRYVLLTNSRAQAQLPARRRTLKLGRTGLQFGVESLVSQG